MVNFPPKFLENIPFWIYPGKLNIPIIGNPGGLCVSSGEVPFKRGGGPSAKENGLMQMEGIDSLPFIKHSLIIILSIRRSGNTILRFLAPSGGYIQYDIWLILHGIKGNLINGHVLRTFIGSVNTLYSIYSYMNSVFYRCHILPKYNLGACLLCFYAEFMSKLTKLPRVQNYIWLYRVYTE